jgi:hypothetical protein
MTNTSRPPAVPEGIERIEGINGPERAEGPAASGDFIWVDGTVTYAGVAEDGTIYIQLSVPQHPFIRVYSATPLARKEMLATALAALTSCRPVKAMLTTYSQYGVIQRLYVVGQ